MAQESCLPSANNFRKRSSSNKQLRAIVKRSIDIPNPNTYFMDYKKAVSRPSDRYIMQNVSMFESPLKKRRGRPRKHASSNGFRTGSGGDRGEEEEEELVALVDPPLFSEDEEEEENVAAVPSIIRTRSGRTVKIKKEDKGFSYYDNPGQQLCMEDLGKGERQREESVPLVVKGKRGRKRKYFDDPPVSLSAAHVVSGTNVLQSKPSAIINDYDSVTRIGNEGFRLSKLPKVKEEITHHAETCEIGITQDERESTMKMDNLKGLNNTAEEFLNDYECFLCLKVFLTKEECEKHLKDHLSKVDTVSAGEGTSGGGLRSVVTSGGGGTGEGGVVCSKSHTSNQDQIHIQILGTPNNSDVDTIQISSKDPPPADDQEGGSSNCQPESFTCSVCSEGFETEYDLLSHSHDTVNECKFCGKKYQNRVNLQTHMKKYHEETDWMKFRCATCGKNFGFLLALERHMKEHNPNQRFCCEQCGKVFKSLTNLKNHIPLHTKDEVYECQYCPKKYYIKYSFDKHVKSHLCDPKFHCDVCNKSFQEKKVFEIHLERHQRGGCLGRSKDYKCNSCGDIKSPDEVAMLSGTDSGHHKTCVECGKGFYKHFLIENIESVSTQNIMDPMSNQNMASLNRDERIRKQCRLCSKYVLNLAKHIKNAHLENEYTSCDICGLMVTKASLPSHKNRKHGGSAVTCDHCNRVFKNIMCLREHMNKVRRKLNPLKRACKICKQVVLPCDWKLHMASHKTTCNTCGSSNFSNHDELLMHLETCKKCGNCGTLLQSHSEFLAHIEMCGRSSDIMSDTLDTSTTAGDQEVVTSIFAIVDDSTCCETCGEMFEDQVSLAHHIAETHPNVLPQGHLLGEETMIDEAVLYACPQESCGVIVTNKDLLKTHLFSAHAVNILNDTFT